MRTLYVGNFIIQKAGAPEEVINTLKDILKVSFQFVKLDMINVHVSHIEDDKYSASLAFKDTDAIKDSHDHVCYGIYQLDKFVTILGASMIEKPDNSNIGSNIILEGNNFYKSLLYTGEYDEKEDIFKDRLDRDTGVHRL